MHMSGKEYKNIKLLVMTNFSCDVILGHSFLCEHSSVKIPFGGPLWRHSIPDTKFIQSEISQMLKEGILEPSQSPWRTQTLVVSLENHKKRFVMDYSQTINIFTLLDAYPLPWIEDMVNEMASYRVSSTLDLTSAYHQVAIKPEERKCTAFEAVGSIYQFCQIPFGVTNGVASF